MRQQEFTEQVRRHGWSFLGDEVATVDGAASDVAGPPLPYLQWVIPFVHRPLAAPKHLCRSLNGALGYLVGVFVGAVHSGRGAILRAYCGDPFWVAELFPVDRSDVRIEHVAGRGPAVEHVIDEDLRRCGDECFRHRLGRGHERPHPEAEREFGIR